MGVKHLAFDKRLLATASIYHLEKNNAIVYANHPDNEDLYVQRGQEAARGVELELNGKVNDQIMVLANYAYNDAKITEDTDPANINKPKENAPKHAGLLNVRYSFLPNWAIEGGVQYVGGRHTFVEALKLPSYTIFNAGLQFKQPSYEAALTVKNLTDKVHWTGGYNFGRLFPGNPRQVDLSVSYRF